MTNSDVIAEVLKIIDNKNNELSEGEQQALKVFVDSPVIKACHELVRGHIYDLRTKIIKLHKEVILKGD